VIHSDFGVLCVKEVERERKSARDRERGREKEGGKTRERQGERQRGRTTGRESASARTRERVCVTDIGWLRLVGSLKLQVSFAEYRLFYRALLQKRPMFLRSPLIVATPYWAMHSDFDVWCV